jgi:SAM-dependent methyltransferase
MIQTTNVFSDQYIKDQLEFYNGKPWSKENVAISIESPSGRIDDYLNINFRKSLPPTPILRIDGGIWMSLTPMELQSAHVPICRATGHVVTGGLGLGYFVLACMANENVTSITVYEINPIIIEYFKESFSDREGFEKVTFVEGDMRELFKDQECDFAFIDIYQTLCPDELITDASQFLNNNIIGEYRVWGQEKIMFEGLNNEIHCEVSYEDKMFFIEFLESEFVGLYREGLNTDYIEKALDALGILL